MKLENEKFEITFAHRDDKFVEMHLLQKITGAHWKEVKHVKILELIAAHINKLNNAE